MKRPDNELKVDEEEVAYYQELLNQTDQIDVEKDDVQDLQESNF